MATSRPKRKRKSRFIVVDGFRVLKANNYSLQAGCISVLKSRSGRRIAATATVSKARNAYQIFVAEKRAGESDGGKAGGLDGYRKFIKDVAALWAALPEGGKGGKAEYKKRAIQEKKSREERIDTITAEANADSDLDSNSDEAKVDDFSDDPYGDLRYDSETGESSDRSRSDDGDWRTKKKRKVKKKKVVKKNKKKTQKKVAKKKSKKR